MGGATPYVRCLAGDAPDERAWSVGAARLAIEERVLSIAAVGEGPVVAFAGPGPSDAPLDAALEGVGEASPALVLVLGAIGDEEPIAKRTLAALATLDVPVLVLAGGRDDATVWARAFESLEPEARDRVVDVTAIDRVVVGEREWLPIAGAPRGRYARTDTACGFSDDDLDARAEALGPAAEGRERTLLSWVGPAGFGLLGLTNADAGDPALATFAERVGAPRGVFASPAVAAGGDRAVLARPLVGPAIELADGTRLPPGFVTLPDGTR